MILSLRSLDFFFRYGTGTLPIDVGPTGGVVGNTGRGTRRRGRGRGSRRRSGRHFVHHHPVAGKGAVAKTYTRMIDTCVGRLFQEDPRQSVVVAGVANQANPITITVITIIQYHPSYLADIHPRTDADNRTHMLLYKDRQTSMSKAIPR